MGPNTVVLPDDWMSRSHRIQNANTDSKVGWCRDIRDLFLPNSPTRSSTTEGRKYGLDQNQLDIVVSFGMCSGLLQSACTLNGKIRKAWISRGRGGADPHWAGADVREGGLIPGRLSSIGVKSREFIDAFDEEIGTFGTPLLQRLDRRLMLQCPLWN